MTTGNERNRQIFNSKMKFNTTSMARLLILKLLMDRSYYGNEVIESIEKIMKGQWRPSPGMIYPLLRNMEENEWVSGWWDEPDKKSIRHYKITDEGIKYYNRIKLIYEPELKESQRIIQAVIEAVY